LIQVILAFIISFAIALALTPVARWLGMSCGALDMPGKRKSHTRPIPRIGGLAILASLLLSVFLCSLLFTNVFDTLCWTSQRVYYVFGGLLIFSAGFFDDFKRLTPRTKFFFQILAASLAFYGGVRIEHILGFQVGGIYFNLLSWAITVFWFLLFINAINLIDGLDGLAAGITFFAVLAMAFLAAVKGDYLLAIKFAILCGVLLGFLFYNYNPASIFLGDGGTYVIGYTIAALSIIGSVKSTAGAAFLIPLVVLGVPVFDTILAPVRRFLSGKNIFRADDEHIHHKLLQKGIKSKNVVLILYGTTCALCFLAIVMINLRDSLAALVLGVLAVLALLFVRKLGYFEYLFMDRIYGWFRDITDATRHTSYDGSFLDLQAEIKKSDNMDSFWDNLCKAFEFMQFDAAELHVMKRSDPASAKPGIPLTWQTGNVAEKGMMSIEISVGAGNPVTVRLVLLKNLAAENIRPFTIRRVKLLRQSMEEALNKIYA